MVEPIRNPRIQEAEAGESLVQNQPELHNKFKSQPGLNRKTLSQTNQVGW